MSVVSRQNGEMFFREGGGEAGEDAEESREI